MKATILVRDLVKLIAKHGDLDVSICVHNGTKEVDAELFSVDEIRSPVFPGEEVTAFEIYGEEQ